MNSNSRLEKKYLACLINKSRQCNSATCNQNMLTELQNALSQRLDMYEILELAREARQKIREMRDWGKAMECEELIYKLEQKCINGYTAH